MLKIIQLLFRDAELAVRHNPMQGFSAAAKGPLGVIALIVIVAILAFAAKAFWA